MPLNPRPWIQVRWPVRHDCVGFLSTLFFTPTCFFYFPLYQFVSSSISGFCSRRWIHCDSPSPLLPSLILRSALPPYFFVLASPRYRFQLFLSHFLSNIESNLDFASNGSGRNELELRRTARESFVLFLPFAFSFFTNFILLRTFLVGNTRRDISTCKYSDKRAT